MKKVKFGVVGVGRIGKLHIDNLTHLIPEAEVVAVADPFIDAAREWLASYPIPAVYQDYHELLQNPEVEAVIVASSTDTHAEVSIAAAKAGKHIFCEKPVDRDVDLIKNVLAAVEENNVLFQVGFNRRFDHNFRRVRDHVDSGALGEPHIVRITSRDPAPPPVEYIKVSGGLFLDMMIHDFDMARFLSGSEAVEVSAHGACLVNPEIAAAGDVDTATVTLRMANGALVIIDNSRQAVYGYDQRVEVFGSKGLATAANDKPSTVELSTAERVSTDQIPYFFLERYTGAFVDQFKAFIDTLRNGKPLAVDGLAGLRSVEIALAAGRSLREGKTIRL